MDTLELALAQAANGWPVFPCRADKAPLTAEGFRSASTDPELIRAWWAKSPDALVGVAIPEGLTVIDLDRHDGRDGIALAESNGWPVHADLEYESLSGSGRHLVYRGEASNSAVVPDYIDRRAGGRGYVVAPTLLPPVETVTEPLPEPYRSRPVAQVPVDPEALSWLSDGEPSPYVAGWIGMLPEELRGWNSVPPLTAELANLTYAGQSGTRAAFDALEAAWSRAEHNTPEPEWPARSMAMMLTSNRPPWIDEPELFAADVLADIDALPETEDDLLPMLSLESLRSRPAPRWLVNDLIQEGTVAVLAGEPGIGKSFLSVSIAGSVASGRPFFGEAVTQTGVVYIAGEGINGMPARVNAWEADNGPIPEDALMFVEEGVSLSDEASIDRLARTMLARGMQLAIFDTLSQLSDLDDENSSAQVAKVLRQAASLNRHGLTALIVHHVTKAENAKVRGSSAIRGNVDTVIVAKAKGETFRISTERSDDGKQRNGAPIRWDGFSLESAHGSAIIRRIGAVDPELAVIREVLDDGEPHGIGDFLAALGDESAAASKRLRRRLSSMDSVTPGGSTSARTWQSNARPF